MQVKRVLKLNIKSTLPTSASLSPLRKKPELSFCFHQAIFGFLLMLSPKVSFIYGYYSISSTDKLNMPPHFYEFPDTLFWAIVIFFYSWSGSFESALYRFDCMELLINSKISLQLTSIFQIWIMKADRSFRIEDCAISFYLLIRGCIKKQRLSKRGVFKNILISFLNQKKYFVVLINYIFVWV